jgi:hypothetical protein
MTVLTIVSGVVVLAWVVLASLIPYLRDRYQFNASWLMVALGVPVLGWLTLNWGPGIGVGAFALGFCVLLRQPLRPRQSPAANLLTPAPQPPEQGQP